MSRHLDWPGVWNARDLGGLPVAGGGVIRRGVLVRSDAVDFGSGVRWDDVVAHGVRTVIDLRSPRELRARTAAVSPALALRRVPLLPEHDPRTLSAILLSQHPRDTYRLLLEHCALQLGRAVEAIAGAEAGGVLVHCQAGRDRTGVLIALVLSAVGVSDELIAEDYAASATRLRVFFEANCHDPRTRAVGLLENQCPAEVMIEVLETMRARHGSAEGYLRSASVEYTTVERLRGRLL